MDNISDINNIEQIIVNDITNFRSALLTFIPNRRLMDMAYPLKPINFNTEYSVDKHVKIMEMLKKVIQSDYDFYFIDINLYIIIIDLFDYFKIISLTKTFLLFVSKLINYSVKRNQIGTIVHMINNFPYLKNIALKHVYLLSEFHDELDITLIYMLISISVRHILKPISRVICENCINYSLGINECDKCHLLFYCSKEECINRKKEHEQLCVFYCLFFS